MKNMKPKTPSLEVITRIVINRIAVWHYYETPTENGPEIFWRKVKGGPGFNLTPRLSTMKTPDQMVSIVTSRLTRLHQIPLFKNQDLVLLMEEPAYRWWISGETLNVIRKGTHKCKHAFFVNGICARCGESIRHHDTLENHRV